MNYIAGFHAVGALLHTEPESIVEVLILNSRNDARIEAILQLTQTLSIPVRSLSRQELDQLLPNTAHQGIIAKHRSFSGFNTGFNESILTPMLAAYPRSLLLLVLDGIQDPHNLGNCLRTANGFGVHAVIAPKDRACGLTPVVHKVACGATSITPFVQVTNLSRTLKNLQEQGVWIVGMQGCAEQTIATVDLRGPIAIVLGNEGQGIRKLTLAHCDYLARIPLSGSVQSFNVAVATAISLYETIRQRNA